MADEGGGLRGLFARADFRRLLVGQGVSALGDWMATVALMALVLDLSRSSTAVGGILVLRLAPAAIAGPLASRVVRRWDRRRTMLAMDLARAAIVGLIPIVHALWWVYVWAFLLEVCGLVFLPARDAAIPDLAGERELPLANGLVLGSSYGTIPFGAGAFAVVAAVAGRHRNVAVFWVDVVTFMISFAMIARMTALGRAEPEAGQEEAGFLDALRLPLVRAVAPATLVIALGLGALFSIGIVYVREVLHATTTEFGVLVALFGVGAGFGLAGLHLSGRSDLATIRRLVGMQGAVVAAMSLAPTVALAFLGAVLFGAATSAALAAAMSVLQERLDDHERVLAFTAFHVLIRGGLAAAAIAAGAVADVLADVTWPGVGTLEPARVVLLSSGLLVVLTAAASRGLSSPESSPRARLPRSAT
jgi:MFS family permease